MAGSPPASPCAYHIKGTASYHRTLFLKDFRVLGHIVTNYFKLLSTHYKEKAEYSYACDLFFLKKVLRSSFLLIKRKMATATRGMTKKKNTSSPSLSAVLLARKKTVHCRSVTLHSKGLHPEGASLCVSYCMWFTLASVLFNLLVLPCADVRTTHVSRKSSVTHEAASYQQTLLHMACSPAPVLHHTWSLSALDAAAQSEGVWCVLLFVRHFSTGETLPRVTLFLGQSMHSGVTAEQFSPETAPCQGNAFIFS